MALRIAFLFVFFILFFCSLRIPLDERLVPVSRLDYQNIILSLCASLLFFAYESTETNANDDSLFLPEQRNRNDFESSEYTDKQQQRPSLRVCRVDCGFPSLHNSEEKRKGTINDDRERE